MIPPDDANALPDALREFYLRSHRVFDRAMSARGASLAKTKLLMFVAETDPVRSADIIRSFGFAPRTVTEALDTLEREGLLRRVPDPADRRTKLLKITEAGATVIAFTEPVRRELRAQVFDVLSDAEKRTLALCMSKLIDRLSQIESQGGPGAPPADRREEPAISGS